jgi:peroxiredoxin
MKILTVLFLILVFSFAASAQQNKRSKPLAENFSAAGLNGQTIELNNLKGKVVLITFWTTKCPICAAEIPKLNQLAASYKDKDVVFLGLTTDNESKIKDYIKRKPFNFNLVPNSFGILLKYADKDGDGNLSFGYPGHFLINQNGEIVLKANGFDKTEILDKEIKRLLNSNQRKSE